MKDESRTKKALILELGELHRQISDMKISEEEKQLVQHALEASETRYRRLFETAQDGILIIDAETEQIIDVNPFLINMLHYSREDLVGKKLWEIGPFKDTVLSMASFETLQRVGYIRYDHLPLETKEGTGVDVEFVSNVYLVDSQRIIQCNIRDITETKRAELGLRNYHEHLGLVNKILRHDLINDLAVIKSALTLYQGSKDASLLAETLERVNKIITLIRKMQELEMFMSTHRNLKLFTKREVVDAVAGSYSGITVTVEGDCRVMADESLHSVIDNIFRNAVVHGKTYRISVTLLEHNGTGEVRIADNGMGIPDELKDKVFMEGYVHGEKGHTGLGLYIVRKAMLNFGGMVYIEDNQPHGAVFVLRFRTIRRRSKDS
jgi:PAS domain S-box-containing protein